MKNYSFRTLNSEDINDLFTLASDPVIRKNSLCSSKITYEIHKKWFAAQLASNAHIFYIIKSTSDELIGYVRFHEEVQYQDSLIITIHLAEQFRGLECKLINQFTIKVLSELAAKSILVKIKKDNVASHKSFQKSGYTFVKSDTVNGHSVNILSFEKS